MSKIKSYIKNFLKYSKKNISILFFIILFLFIIFWKIFLFKLPFLKILSIFIVILGFITIDVLFKLFLFKNFSYKDEKNKLIASIIFIFYQLFIAIVIISTFIFIFKNFLS